MIGDLTYPGIGSLELVETYEFYDEPVLFACRDSTDRTYLGVLAADEADHKTWLYAPLSPQRYKQVRSGGMDLFNAFKSAEGGELLRVIVLRADATAQAEWVAKADVSDDLLPLPGEMLDLDTVTLAPAPDADLRTSRQIHRDVLTLRLQFEGSHRTEAPAGLLGQVLDSVQQVVNAIGQAVAGKATARGVLPADILDKMQLAVTGVFAGSFGVEFHAKQPAQGDLFQTPEVTRALQEFVLLLEATATDEAMLARLTDLKGRTVAKYRDLMLRLSNQITDAEVRWASPGMPETKSVRLTGETARRAAKALGAATPDASIDFDIVGRLVGFNSRTKTFELWDVGEGRKYSGRVDDDALADIGAAVIDEVYSAWLRERNELTPDSEPKTSYRLLRLGDSGGDSPAGATDESAE